MVIKSLAGFHACATFTGNACYQQFIHYVVSMSSLGVEPDQRDQHNLASDVIDSVSLMGCVLT